MSGVSLPQRLSAALAEVATVVEEPDGALTVSHAGAVASLRVVTIAEGLEMVSLTQPLAWDLPLNAKLRTKVSEHAAHTVLGTVALIEKTPEKPSAKHAGTAANGDSETTARRRTPSKKVADVMLRYNFPGAGLSDDALRTLIMMVLAAGSDVRRALLA
ncbi:hypothetical protein MU0050_001692 [[Mycobacterium] wendilense]|uniref:Uncharacterized protein n=1 Tax=[Mycobacterium] wendilense TaxID=3064284 RepID=A0ABM9MCA5_9MYCO|nr:hypothetical protein [Mycolicibacterium sp. MU0050]CAJ1581732.1 hypothetical protein MU0050_001692 [Mycolicibacterium sp. MU0050]